MSDAILVLNAGSSSLKFAIYDPDREDASALVRGSVEKDSIVARDGDGADLADNAAPPDAGTVERLLAWIGARRVTLRAVGHRIVHGGTQFAQPVALTSDVVAKLQALTPLAPLHQPRSLQPIEAIGRALPDVVQVGCFDTAFHRTIPAPANRYAIPLEYEAKGVRRYGFHGLSYAHVASRLPEILPGRRKVIAAHLGSGASLCAMLDGRSVDTTMGFSALDGLVMATRPGLIDPGILLFLLKEEGLSPDAVEDMLYHRSGLLGASGLSGDIRVLAASQDARAAAAIELFAYRIARETAAMANALGGFEALVFTGGIGEHSAPVRRLVCERLGWLGVELNRAANEAGEGAIDAQGSHVAVRVLATDEEAVIARDVRPLMRSNKA